MTQYPSSELDAILDAMRNLQRKPSRPDTVVTLTGIVVLADAVLLGKVVHSPAELGLRAQALGMLLGLDELREAMCQAGNRGRHLYSGRFREFIHVFNQAFDSLPHVHRRLRQAQASSGSAAYYDGIRAAQDAMASIGADADLRSFLLDGARNDDERFRRACTQIQELLAFRFAVRPLSENRETDRPRHQPGLTPEPCAAPSLWL